MSHELATRADGKKAMAYVGKTPWHVLGEELKPGAPLEVWTTAAGLDWEALVTPSQYEFGGQLVTDHNAFHMVRSDTGASLSVMSKKYKPVQPAEVMGFFRDFILTDERFQLETAGALKGGRVIWGLAKFSDPMTVAGDAHTPYVLLTTSYNGTMATTAQGTMVRVVCNNTLTASVYGGEKAMVKVPHYKDFGNATVKADAVERLGLIVTGYDRYKALGEALAGVKLAAFQVEGLFKRLTIDKAAKGDTDKTPTSKSRNQLEALLSSYRDTLAEGTQGGTAWAVLNGVTRYVDHARTTRDTAGEGAGGARMASALLGSGAGLKREALDVLADLGHIKLANAA
jgi:phage/plasmid-like protein (TIGR03299 family)